MTRREFEKLIRTYLLKHFPGFGIKGDLLFARPMRYILRGFCFEPSGFDRYAFYLNVFMEPLFVPNSGIVFSIGDRVGRGWTISSETEPRIMTDVLKYMQREGPRILEKFKSLRDIADHVVAFHQNKHDLYAPEMAAYAAILLDDSKIAKKMFDCAEKRIAMDNDRRDWVVALIDRIRTMRRTFEHDPQEAKSILHRWRDETAANLKLSEFIDDTAPA